MPGFLTSQPRMNVSLTRCKKGMVVVTDKAFLQRAGKRTLLGKLCHTWSRRHNTCWIGWKAMLNNSVALPGLPLPLSSPPPPRLHDMLAPALLASTSQQLPALTRIDEESLIESFNLLRTALTLASAPPSEPQTQTRTRTRTTHKAPPSTPAAGPAPGGASTTKPSGRHRRKKTVKATDTARLSVHNNGPRRGSSSGGNPDGGHGSTSTRRAG
jgi:hypothetical protein